MHFHLHEFFEMYYFRNNLGKMENRETANSYSWETALYMYVYICLCLSLPLSLSL